MHLSKLMIRGLRTSEEHDLNVRQPGRFGVLIGANSASKSTGAEALQLVHTKVFRRLPAPSAAVLGVGERTVEVEYAYSDSQHPSAAKTSI